RSIATVPRRGGASSDCSGSTSIVSCWRTGESSSVEDPPRCATRIAGYSPRRLQEVEQVLVLVVGGVVARRPSVRVRVPGVDVVVLAAGLGLVGARLTAEVRRSAGVRARAADSEALVCRELVAERDPAAARRLGVGLCLRHLASLLLERDAGVLDPLRDRVAIDVLGCRVTGRLDGLELGLLQPS